MRRELLRLATDPAYRRASGRILLSGHHVVAEAPSEHLAVYATVRYLRAHPTARPVELISEALAQRLTREARPEGVLATTPHPGNLFAAPLPACPRTLVLCGLADPRNIGALARTALALGWHQLVLYAPSGSNAVTDPFSIEAIRCSQGAVLRLPRIVVTDSLDALQNIYLAEPTERQPAVDQAAPLTLVLGAESHGLRGLPAALRQRAQPIGIHTDAAMPFLNVAAAAAILMHSLR